MSKSPRPHTHARTDTVNLWLHLYHSYGPGDEIISTVSVSMLLDLGLKWYTVYKMYDQLIYYEQLNIK